MYPFPVPYTVGPVYLPLGYPSTPPQGWFPPHQGEDVLPRATCELQTRPVLSSHTVVSVDSAGVLLECVWGVMRIANQSQETDPLHMLFLFSLLIALLVEVEYSPCTVNSHPLPSPLTGIHIHPYWGAPDLSGIRAPPPPLAPSTPSMVAPAPPTQPFTAASDPPGPSQRGVWHCL